MANGRKMTKKFAVDEEAFERIKEFKDGLGANYAEAIKLLLDIALEDGESEFSAGHRLRAKLRPELED